jgi:hypothetical protein
LFNIEYVVELAYCLPVKFALDKSACVGVFVSQELTKAIDPGCVENIQDTGAGDPVLAITVRE